MTNKYPLCILDNKELKNFIDTDYYKCLNGSFIVVNDHSKLGVDIFSCLVKLTQNGSINIRSILSISS